MKDANENNHDCIALQLFFPSPMMTVHCKIKQPCDLLIQI